MRAHCELADLAIIGGDVFAAARVDRETLQRLYREGFAIYEAARAAGPDFEALAGVEFSALEFALEAIGWLIASPDERERIGSSQFMITREGVVSNAG